MKKKGWVSSNCIIPQTPNRTDPQIPIYYYYVELGEISEFFLFLRQDVFAARSIKNSIAIFISLMVLPTFLISIVYH